MSLPGRADDHLAIIDAVNRVALLADHREWDALRAVFAPVVEVDYSALSGQPPEDLDADVLIYERWRPLLESFDATQHLVADHLVDDGDGQALCRCEVQATHFRAAERDDPTWTVGGAYRYRLARTSAGWLIQAMSFTPRWARGNPALGTWTPSDNAAGGDA